MPASSSEPVLTVHDATGHSTLALVIGAVGVLLRLRLFLAGRSLWLDEALISLNIAGRPWAGFLEPLDYAQAAPTGWLLIEKLCTTLFGNGERALRLVPLVASVAAIPMFYHLARRLVGTRPAVIALSFFALGGPLLYYANEAKPYGSDVFWTVAIVMAALPFFHTDTEPRDWIVLGSLGTVAVWFSYPSVFVLAGVGMVYVCREVVHRRFGRAVRFAGLALPWGASLGVIYAIQVQAARNSMIQFRSLWSGFPSSRSPLGLASWFYNRWFAYVADNAELAFGGLTLLILILGALYLLRRERWLLGLVVAPVLVGLIAAIVGMYPFTGRLILFTLPLFYVLLGAGIVALSPIRFGGFVTAGTVALALLVARPAKDALSEFVAPTGREEIADALAYVESHREPDDGVYVWLGARAPFEYYARYRQILDVDDGHTIFGGQFGEDRGDFLGAEEPQRLLAFPRVWAIGAHDWDRNGQFAMEYLGRFGTPVDSFSTVGAAAVLFRLDHDAILRAVNP